MLILCSLSTLGGPSSHPCGAFLWIKKQGGVSLGTLVLSVNYCNTLILLDQDILVPSVRKSSIQINKIWDVGGASSEFVSVRCTTCSLPTAALTLHCPLTFLVMLAVATLAIQLRPGDGWLCLSGCLPAVYSFQERVAWGNHTVQSHRIVLKLNFDKMRIRCSVIGY